ncbi:MAG: 4Fe-4S binding protein [Treponema sp.]|jgi:heterodisulfide reductase subunit A-like polyferredoxin|nr:4Fe-4S binding protein [Treponema sp.]MDR2797629.1 4Fe-4S binding protein [Treponema sp.]
MAYTVNQAECANCEACVSECEAGAISEKDGAQWIDPAKCQDCGKCAEACPSEAIAKA